VNRAVALLTVLLSSAIRAGTAAGAGPADAASAGAILVKGAWSSASDSTTPLPEGGRQSGAEYRSDYFGFSYHAAPNWIERYQGPPPSDRGYYVLAQLAPALPARSGADSSHLLISAQDAFFSAFEINDALEMLSNLSEHLDGSYLIERAPALVRIADRPFVRFDYTSPASGLHWHVLATDIRCHIVQFVFTGRSEPVLAHLIHDMGRMVFSTDGGVGPVCIKNYSASEYLIEREEPVFQEPRFNAVPVRVIVDVQGKIRHIHFLNAFPDQAKSIAEALSRWQFKPYLLNGRPVEVETGILFGHSAGRSAQIIQ
jgi:hypothetical protein